MKYINMISTRKVAWGAKMGHYIPQEGKRKGGAWVNCPSHLSFGGVLTFPMLS